MLARELWTTILLISGCAGGAAPSAPPAARSPEPAPSSKPATLPDPVSKEPLFEPGALPRPSAPAIKVVAPAAGVSLAPAGARSTAIVLDLEGRDATFVELSLDGARARPLAMLPTPPKLGDLEASSKAFEVGEHYLVVSFRPEADGPASHALTRFQIGAGPGKSPTPLVYCSRPEGTHYGPADSKLLFDIVTDGVPDGGAQVRVDVFDPREPGRVQRRGFVSGDEAARWVSLRGAELTFELTLIDRTGLPFEHVFARDSCSVTVNEVKP